MNWETIQGRWNEYKASAKQKWDKLSEAQLAGTGGNRQFLASRIQEAYALSKEEAERQLSDWQDRQFDRKAPAANS